MEEGTAAAQAAGSWGLLCLRAAPFPGEGVLKWPIDPSCECLGRVGMGVVRAGLPGETQKEIQMQNRTPQWCLGGDSRGTLCDLKFSGLLCPEWGGLLAPVG